MEALVVLVFVTGICGAPPQDDWQLAVQNCPTDTPWGSGNTSSSDCDVLDPFACNGLGTCECGICKCKERDNPEETVSGRLCECTNFLCNNVLGLHCSGPDHGVCVCNTCECKPGWTGDDCGCSESVENCKNPLTGDICSDHGICECNSCSRCDVVEGGRCSGRWCENCPDPQRRRRHRNKEEREQRRRERKQRKKQRNGAVSERLNATAELCPPDTPWGPEAFDDSSCKETETSRPCSGRGTCTCGQCSCDLSPNHLEVTSGQFCECTNFLCDRHNGLLCSGPDHGECVCNRCQCKPGWTGEACECEESVENCRNPETGEICSNQGLCECNECRCSASEGVRYSGKWCEDCPTCRGRCVEYKSCVQCQAFGTGELSEEECRLECKLFNSTMVQVARVETEADRSCSFFDENDCRFAFVYGYDDEGDAVVRVRQTLECPPPSFGRGAVFSGPPNKSPTCFARAREPAPSDHCHQRTLRFQYEPERDRCEPVSVCGGNAGTFPSPDVCQKACHTGAPPVSDVSCDRSRCPWSRWSHYLAKKCQPLYAKGFCCPTRFSCPRETQQMQDSTRCFYRGSFYQPGEEVPVGNPCLGSCRCVVGVLPDIECQSECQDIDQPGPGCRHLFNPGACCPHAQDCEERNSPVNPRDKVTCSWGNKTYFEGERMTSDDLPCQACVCTSSFTNITGYGCYTMDCGLERYISKLQSGCTPIFYEKKCCPTDWLCPGDPRISRSSTRKLRQKQEAHSQSTCRLGDLTIGIGSKVKIRGRKVICRCVTPPDLTCVWYRSRAEAQRHSRLRKADCPKISCDPMCTKVLNEATRCSECSCTANTLSCNELECPENCRYDIDPNTGCPTCTDCV